MAELVSAASQLETSVVILQEKVEKLRKWQAHPHPRRIPQLRLLLQLMRLALRWLLDWEQELAGGAPPVGGLPPPLVALPLASPSSVAMAISWAKKPEAELEAFSAAEMRTHHRVLQGDNPDQGLQHSVRPPELRSQSASLPQG